MGKYDAVLGDLKPAPVADLKHQDKVNEKKTELTVDKTTGEFLPLTPEDLARQYADVRFQKSMLDQQKSALQVTLDALEQLLIASWEAEESGWGAYGSSPNVVKTKEGSAVQIEPLPEGKVENPEAFRLWCVAPPDICMTCGLGFEKHPSMPQGRFDEDSGRMVYPENIDPTVHEFKPGGGLEKKLQLWPSSMNAIAKERCLAGAPPPDGVAIYLRTTVKFTR